MIGYPGYPYRLAPLNPLNPGVSLEQRGANGESAALCLGKRT